MNLGVKVRHFFGLFVNLEYKTSATRNEVKGFESNEPCRNKAC